MTFPIVRMRRLRKNQNLRNLAAETTLHVGDLIYPLFLCDRPDSKTPVASMPGIFQQSINHAVADIEDALELGINTVMLFGIPDEKDAEATSAWAEDGVIQQSVIELKENFGDDLTVMTDVCLCEYMTHGHCGILMGGKVLNDPTLEVLARVAVSHAQAGADIVAPSDMMDGRVAWIRQCLDEEGYPDTPILSYAAKYASSFYAPFREAAESAPTSGDRKTYQMDPRNRREALEEVALDIQEGADMVMVKPALAYLDVISMIRQSVNVPVVAYSVSGEYSMIKAAAQQGWIDEKAVTLETMTSIKRAGADRIITYAAKDVAGWLGADS